MQELSQAQFIALLRQRGIDVSAKEGRLQISAPTGAIDPQLRAELTRRKPELLQALEHSTSPSRRPSLAPAERNGRIPQTHAQQGMWLIDHFAPGNVAYNIPEAFFVEGPVELQHLQTAVDGLLARHETLRTSFYQDDEGELLQAISPDARAQVGYTDLSGIAEADRDRGLRSQIREQSRRPFDLNQPPLVRFHLFRLSGQMQVLFFNIHHIISDARSLIILRQELIALYQAAVRGETAALPELPIQYADYAIWAEQYLATGAMGAQVEYWKAKLAGAPPHLDLPSSRPYPEERTAWGATVLIAIPASLSSSLAEISRHEGVTMFMAMLAAFAALIYRQSGQQDFCIGSPFTHRNQVETEPIIGLFVNMLVFRCQFQGEPSFREVLRRVRATALEAYDHSDLPFQELVRALKPDLRSRRSPLFQIMFGFDSDTRPGQGVQLVQLDTDPGTAKFDLTLELHESSEGISGSFEYCTDLFDAAAIEQLSQQFLALLEKVTSQPDQPISSFEMNAAAPEDVAPLPDTPSEPAGFWKGNIKKLAERLSHRGGSSG
ncbi:MAG: condensation domain-containing protein [Acidobacteriaceae bacterium]